MIRTLLAATLLAWPALALAQTADDLLPPETSAGPYELTADSLPLIDVPKGTVTQHRWENSQIFPNTTRDYWVYVPAQYNADTPAATDANRLAPAEATIRTVEVLQFCS